MNENMGNVFFKGKIYNLDKMEKTEIEELIEKLDKSEQEYFKKLSLISKI